MGLLKFFEKSNWKLKAIKRSQMIKSLNNKIKELIISRNKAKEKNIILMTERDELKKENSTLRKELKKN